MHIEIAEHFDHYAAQYFWPDVMPWPAGVFQRSREGALTDNEYYIALGSIFTSREEADQLRGATILSISSGDLVLSNEHGVVRNVLRAQALKDGQYLIKIVD
jgi:hypothetical protein